VKKVGTETTCRAMKSLKGHSNDNMKWLVLVERERTRK